ncbi:MAG: DNA-processing protein DprA [Patescibacteria group bacterium]
MSNNKTLSEHTQSDLPYWIAWSHVESIGPQKFKLLNAYFPSMEAAWHSGRYDLKQSGLSDKDIITFSARRDELDPAQLFEKIQKLNISIITVIDAAYPRRLKEIHSPPSVLYVKGTLPAHLDLALAVVGTRKTSPYGRTITPTLVGALARTGVIIVSGLALGIDALSHQAAVDAGGQTIAVLGCGLDEIYPVSNRHLADEITAHGGAIVSEYPPGTRPLRQHFPARNRIISGLSRGVLVIEGSEDSGSLITARCAIDQNREVLAVPGNIMSKTSAGPNNLIKMGAKAVTSTEDILAALDLELAEQFRENSAIIPASPDEEKLLGCIGHEPVHIDEIIQKSKLNTSIINSTLTMMEMKGIVRHLGGMYYVRSR